MASAGTVTVDFDAQTASFNAQLKLVTERIKDLNAPIENASKLAKEAFATFGLAVVTSEITQAISASLKFGEAISDASKKAGVSAQAFSELSFAAKIANVDINDLSGAFKKMQVEIAAGGTKIESLGVDLSVLRSLQPDKQFELVAEAISKISDPAIRAAAAVEVFGKQGENLLPLFEDGAKGIRAARIEAERLGLSFTDNQINALADAQDAVDKLKAAYEGFATTLTASVAPALTTLLNGFTNTFAEQTEFQKLNERLSGFVRERNFLLGQIRSKEALNEKFDFLVSDKAIEAAKLQLAEVERRINFVNDKLIKLGTAANAKDIKAAGAVAGVDPSKRTFGDLQGAQTAAINKELEQMAADSASALDKITEDSNQKFFDGQAEKTRVVQRELEKQTEAEQRIADFREQEIANDRARQLELSNIKVDIVQGGLALIAAVTTKDAKLQKKIAIAAATINTIQGVTNQLKSGDPYSAIPRAIAVGIFGAAQIAKIVSTPELGGGGTGSIGGIAGVSIGTQSTSPFNQSPTDPSQLQAQAQPAVLQIVINGNVLSATETADRLFDEIYDRIENGRMLISRNSDQAQMFAVTP